MASVGRLLEVEGRLLVGELTVDSGEHVQLVLSGLLVLLVQGDAQQLGAVGADASALTDDLGRGNDVLQDGVVHRGQGAVARADGNTLAA